MNETIFIASDHAGFGLKKQIINSIKSNLIDLGVDNMNTVDYPDYAKKLVSKISSTENSKGILICGSGIGMSITANRFKGIRAALCRSADDAKLARQHNNANILTLSGRQIDVDEAKNCFKIFINTSFDGGRHQKRVKKID